MTISDSLKKTWHKVRDIMQEALGKKEQRRSWRHVKVMAIDEIAVYKGHRYMTTRAFFDS